MSCLQLLNHARRTFRRCGVPTGKTIGSRCRADAMLEADRKTLRRSARLATMSNDSLTARTLAVVDMGSNSFRLELARVEGDQIYPEDTWREPLRMGAGLDEQGRLTAQARRAALACLARFHERIE